MNIFIVFIANFMVQYILMTFLLSNKKYTFTYNLPKLYLALFIGFVAVLIDFGMRDFRYKVFSYRAYIILGIMISIIAYLYSSHEYVNDSDYLKEMMEHHSSSIMTSNHMLKQTDNYHIIKLAKDIVQTHTDRINNMDQLLRKLENKS